MENEIVEKTKRKYIRLSAEQKAELVNFVGSRVLSDGKLPHGTWKEVTAQFNISFVTAKKIWNSRS